MKKVCLVGDTGEGICYGHSKPTRFTTTFTEGSSHEDVDGKAVCIVGSIGKATCGHMTRATEGSALLSSEGKPVHCVGHKGVMIGADGEYTAVTGSDFLQSD
jgi:hypothetical protein